MRFTRWKKLDSWLHIFTGYKIESALEAQYLSQQCIRDEVLKQCACIYNTIVSSLIICFIPHQDTFWPLEGCRRLLPWVHLGHGVQIHYERVHINPVKLRINSESPMRRSIIPQLGENKMSIIILTSEGYGWRHQPFEAWVWRDLSNIRPCGPGIKVPSTIYSTHCINAEMVGVFVICRFTGSR